MRNMSGFFAFFASNLLFSEKHNSIVWIDDFVYFVRFPDQHGLSTALTLCIISKIHININMYQKTIDLYNHHFSA